MYYVYVLKSEVANKSYVGQTSDIEKRVKEHNSGKSSYTKKYLPWKVVYVEKFNSRIEAVNREKFFKSKTGRKTLKDVIFSS